jgi:hypothetical protein
MSGERTFTDSGILRHFNAAARREERVQILDRLTAAAVEYERRATASGSTRPAVTGWGRHAAGLRSAIEVIDKARGGWSDPELLGDAVASVVNNCDAVELWASDRAPTTEDPDGEPMPVRVVVCDGADDATASAYLSLDDAEQLGTELLQLVARLRADRARRTAIQDRAS